MLLLFLPEAEPGPCTRKVSNAPIRRKVVITLRRLLGLDKRYAIVGVKEIIYIEVSNYEEHDHPAKSRPAHDDRP